MRLVKNFRQYALLFKDTVLTDFITTVYKDVSRIILFVQLTITGWSWESNNTLFILVLLIFLRWKYQLFRSNGEYETPLPFEDEVELTICYHSTENEEDESKISEATTAGLTSKKISTSLKTKVKDFTRRIEIELKVWDYFCTTHTFVV